MDDTEDAPQVPSIQAPELQVPMPEHLVDPAPDEELSMEQVPMTPEEAGFGSLAEVIAEAEDTHDQVAANMDWPQQEAA